MSKIWLYNLQSLSFPIFGKFFIIGGLILSKLGVLPFNEFRLDTSSRKEISFSTALQRSDKLYIMLIGTVAKLLCEINSSEKFVSAEYSAQVLSTSFAIPIGFFKTISVVDLFIKQLLFYLEFYLYSIELTAL